MTATRWAWTLWVAFVVALIGASYTGMNPARGAGISAPDVIWAASFIGFPTAGALVVSRIPRRPLGWMLLISPLVIMVGLTLGEVARYLVDDSRLLAAWMLWISSVGFGVALASLVAVPLYLPNGYLPGPRWKWVGRGAWSYVVLMGLLPALMPGEFIDAPTQLHNPIGVEALRGFLSGGLAVLEPMSLLVVAAGVVSLFVRFRRSSGVERQQLKWLALGAVLLLAIIATLISLEAAGIAAGYAITFGFVLAFLCLPTFIAIAVLKTRLYDVDVVINKTLVYGSLSALLALAYLGLVVALQAVFGDVVRGSDLAVAGSTLAVAALFRPMRERVQGFIDRRFYRSRYDAAETLQTFSARLRDQVDLESLRSDIAAVVHETMQPAHASIWLRSGAE